MLGLEAPCLGDAWNVGMARLRAVTGPAEDLQIIGFVSPVDGFPGGPLNIC
jgi:hypothetical protein